MPQDMITMFSRKGELKLGVRESSNIRAVGLDLHSKYPITVQFHSGQAYSYGVGHVFVPGTNRQIATDQHILDFYNVLVRGGYTVAQVSTGVPGAELSTGALVSRMLVVPTRKTKEYQETDLIASVI